MKIKFVTEVQAYAAPTDIDVDTNCIDILFFNNSASTIFVNGFPVAASATLEINGNEQEINTTKYKIGWNGAVTGECIVIRRKYA